MARTVKARVALVIKPRNNIGCGCGNSGWAGRSNVALIRSGYEEEEEEEMVVVEVEVVVVVVVVMVVEEKRGWGEAVLSLPSLTITTPPPSHHSPPSSSRQPGKQSVCRLHFFSLTLERLIFGRKSWCVSGKR